MTSKTRNDVNTNHDVKKIMMMSKIGHDDKKVCHDVKNRHDAEKIVMTSSARYDVKKLYFFGYFFHKMAAGGHFG